MNRRNHSCRLIHRLPILLFLAVMVSCGVRNNSSIYYVINLHGAKVYERPSVDEKAIDTISIGSVMRVLDLEIKNDFEYISNNLYLEGQWIKLSGKDAVIFSTEVSTINPKVPNVHHEKFEWNLKGKLLDSIVFKEDVTVSNGTFKRLTKTFEFENWTQTSIFWDGCIDNKTVSNKLSLSEMYNQMTYDHLIIDETNNRLIVPTAIYQDDKIIEFVDEALITDLQLAVDKSGAMNVTSYYRN